MVQNFAENAFYCPHDSVASTKQPYPKETDSLIEIMIGTSFVEKREKSTEMVEMKSQMSLLDFKSYFQKKLLELYLLYGSNSRFISANIIKDNNGHVTCSLQQLFKA